MAVLLSLPTLMNTTADIESQAAAALRAGDAATARRLYTELAYADRTEASVLLGLAYACRALNDDAGKIVAVDHLLSHEPNNIRALILKADHLALGGDGRAAVAFYRAVLRVAAVLQTVPADLVTELRRVQAAADRYAAEFEEFLRTHLSRRGFDERHSDVRFAEALDLLVGKRQVFLQSPRFFYYPGLPQIQFYPREKFPWFDALERSSDAIRDELLEVLKEPSAFAPYVQKKNNRPHNEQAGMLNNPDWSAFFLWKNGEEIPENAARCPRTMQAFSEVPLARVPNRSPSILFSLLRPGTHIPAHSGMVNTRLICHLPLIVPGKCTFRVGNEVRQWQEGRGWLFDDTVEHEAWNETDQTRVVMIFDVWKPELSDEERAQVIALFEAIDAYSGTKPHWEI